MNDSVKDQFSEDEWYLISSVPGLIGAAMAGAGKSGVIGTAKEAMASMKSMMAGKTDYPDNELINAVLIKAENFSDAKEKAGAYREKAMAQIKEQNVQSPEDFNRMALDNASKAIAMVKERRSDTEANQYQEWCINVAKKVAEAASEGGFMGFGGEQVSDGERAFMDELKKVFTVIS